MIDQLHTPDIQLAFFPGFAELIAFGVPAAINFFSGRGERKSQEKIHDRQATSEETRHQQSLEADERKDMRRDERYREYVRSQLRIAEAERKRKANAARGVAGNLHGLPQGFDIGSLVGSGGGVMPPMAGGGASAGPLPVTTAGPAPPSAPGGRTNVQDTLAILQMLSGMDQPLRRGRRTTPGAPSVSGRPTMGPFNPRQAAVASVA